MKESNHAAVAKCRSVSAKVSAQWSSLAADVGDSQ